VEEILVIVEPLMDPVLPSERDVSVATPLRS
jgi:hypothetical protein